MKIHNSIAIVTGANRGIGKALVEALINHGATKVYAAMRDIKSSPFEKPSRIVPVPLDVTKETSIAALIKIIVLAFNLFFHAKYEHSIGKTMKPIFLW